VPGPLLQLSLAAQRHHHHFTPASPPPVRVTATSNSSSTGPVRNWTGSPWPAACARPSSRRTAAIVSARLGNLPSPSPTPAHPLHPASSPWRQQLPHHRNPGSYKNGG